MAEEPPYILEIEGLDEAPPDDDQPARGPRRWIGVRFECCNSYTRIYRNREGTAYVGYCPRCAKRVQVRVGPAGTHHRMFRAH